MTCPDGLRLGVVTARSVSTAAGIWTETSLARLIDLLRQKAGRVVFAPSLSPVRQSLHDCRLTLPTADFLPLPWLPTLRTGLSKFAACRQVLRRVAADCDVVLTQLPFASPLALPVLHGPQVYHLCADIEEPIVRSPCYGGARGLPARLAARRMPHLQKRLPASPAARVVANGRSLLARYGGRGAAVVSSTLLASEIGSVSRRRSISEPFRVLYVGYLRHEKGIDVLVDAFTRLAAGPRRCELMIVGASHSVEQGVLGSLGASLDDLRRRGLLQLVDAVPFGPRLFQLFADADVLAVPSRWEGTPRVLVEARAFGCPVVASDVGGIPSSVSDGEDGLLVPPGNPEALASALLRGASEPALREHLVRQGLARAREASIEHFVDTIWEVVRDCAREAGPRR